MISSLTKLKPLGIPWLIFTVVLVILFFYADTARALDFNFHEKRYSLTEESICALLIAVSLLFSLYYSRVTFRLGYILSVIHFLSFSTLLVSVWLPYKGMSGLPNRYYVNTVLSESSWSYWAGLFLIGQCAWLLHILLYLLKRRKLNSLFQKP